MSFSQWYSYTRGSPGSTPASGLSSPRASESLQSASPKLCSKEPFHSTSALQCNKQGSAGPACTVTSGQAFRLLSSSLPRDKPDCTTVVERFGTCCRRSDWRPGSGLVCRKWPPGGCPPGRRCPDWGRGKRQGCQVATLCRTLSFASQAQRSSSSSHFTARAVGPHPDAHGYCHAWLSTKKSLLEAH